MLANQMFRPSCPNCHAPLAKNAKFCPECGQQFRRISSARSVVPNWQPVQSSARSAEQSKNRVLTETSLILVCVMPTPRDMEIARLLGWYRIPLRTAPKLVAVDYLAFYQPSSFGESGGRIDFIASVRGHELTTRRELLKDEFESSARERRIFQNPNRRIGKIVQSHFC